MIDIFEKKNGTIDFRRSYLSWNENENPIKRKKSGNWYELFEDNHCILQAVSSVLVLTFHSQVEDYEIGM